MIPAGPTRAQSNLIETYVALANAVPGTEVGRDRNIVWAVSDLPHPTCNFAAITNLDPEQADFVARKAINRDVFAVYALDDRSADVLEWADFRETHRLLQMEAQPSSLPREFQVIEAANPQMRSAVSQFMMEQFFPRQTAAFRHTLAQATSDVPNLRLFYHPQHGSIVAAVLLHETPECMGLYNLCVAEDHRSVGLGAGMVQWCRRTSPLPTVLQCRLSLGGWYSSLGFRETGLVRSFVR